MSGEAERYEAAALIERLAVGDEGERREQSRQIILKGGPSAVQAAQHARAALCEEIARLELAIAKLGLIT